MITINETVLKNNNKMKIDGFNTYSRNRQNEHMGGVATAIKSNEAHNTVKVSEGVDKDEYIVTRHGQFQVPINIINVYGEIESRNSNQTVQERWERILEELLKIEQKGEYGLIIGDLNKHIGNLVSGNHDKISFGGQLVRNLVETRNYVLLNGTSKTKGGPFTRYDPAKPENKTCLDLVIIPRDLLKYVQSLEIDKRLLFTPGRPVSKNKITYSDHFSLEIIFKNLPLKSNLAKRGQAFSMWNTNKVGGWEVYKMITENNKKLLKVSDDDDDVDSSVMMKKIHNEMEKAKYKAFGKVKVHSKPKSNECLEELNNEKIEVIEKNPMNKDELIEELDSKITAELLSKQRERFEKEIKSLKEIKATKGKAASIFDLKNRIVGSKKADQEATVVKDPATGKDVHEPAEIKKVSLAYCVKLLTNREPKDKFKDDIELKKRVHEVRMEEIVKDDIELSQDMFENSLKAVKKKGKKYDFITKSGKSIKEAVYNLYENVWDKEGIPSMWRNTTIIQLYKGKGPLEDLNSQRNIHTKLDIPKLFTHMVITAAKDKIINNMSKFQLGTKPKHRAQEHLFVVQKYYSVVQHVWHGCDRTAVRHLKIL